MWTGRHDSKGDLLGLFLLVAVEKETQKTPRLCTYSETSTLAFVWIGTLTLMTFMGSALLETRCQRSVPTVFSSETGDKGIGVTVAEWSMLCSKNRFLHFYIDKDSIIG